MKIYELKCKNCGADLRVAEGRKVIFCEYCGTKHLIDDEVQRAVVTHQGTINYRDEARIKEIEFQEAKWRREDAERKRQEKNKKEAWRVFWVISGFCFLLSLILSFFKNDVFMYSIFLCYVCPFFFPYKYTVKSKLTKVIVWVALWCAFAILFASVFCGVHSLIYPTWLE